MTFSGRLNCDLFMLPADTHIVWVIRGLIPSRDKKFFSAPKHLCWLLGQPTHLFTGYEELIPYGLSGQTVKLAAYLS